MAKSSIIAAALLLLFASSAYAGCLDLWNNQCKTNADCCSGYCEKGSPDWATGICKQSTATPAPVTTAAKPASPVGTSSSNSAGGAVSVTQAEFNQAVTSNGYPAPTTEQYKGYINGISKGGISTKREAAMALAQFLHESAGLVAKREWACKDTQCPGSYNGAGCEAPGQYYYGRGYVQLSWCYNYRDASQGLGLGDTLLNNPDLVATNEQYAWDTAFWFWKERVHNGPYGAQVQNGQFGYATKSINGGLECNGANVDQSEQRFKYYQKIWTAFGLSGNADPSGCY